MQASTLEMLTYCTNSARLDSRLSGRDKPRPNKKRPSSRPSARPDVTRTRVRSILAGSTARPAAVRLIDARPAEGSKRFWAQ